jgi:hypothetical protein
MIKVTGHTEVPLPDWDAKVSSVPEGSIFQTTGWAAYLAETGNRPYFVVARDETGNVKGVLLGYREKVGEEEQDEGRPTFFRFVELRVKRIFPVLRVLNGPLILDKRRAGEICCAIWKEVDRICSADRIFQLRGRRPIHGPAPCVGSVESPTGKEVISSPWGTYLIDLTLTESEMWKRLKRSARKAIRRAQEQGVTVKMIRGGAGLGDYIELLRKTRESLGLAFPPCFPNQKMWNCLGDKGRLQVFVAEVGNAICYGLGVLSFNGILFEIGVARKLDVEAGGFAGDLVKWKIMCWGAEMGNRVYDLTGVAPDPKNRKEEGIRRFKSKFGGAYVEFPLYTKTYSPCKAVLLRQLKKIRLDG